MRVAMNVETIDGLLGGGFESGVITEIYGEAGSGKTNICLQCGYSVVQGKKKVAYIDTEGVSLERLRQISGESAEFVIRNFLIYKPLSMEEMGQNIDSLKKIPDLGLIIVDSINMFTRLGSSQEPGRDRTFLQHTLSLHKLARELDIPVLATAQVYGSGTEVQPFSGRTLAHIVKTIIRLDKTGIGLRKAVIIKHRSEPEYASADFKLTSRGVE